jgi:hypothetical protein
VLIVAVINKCGANVIPFAFSISFILGAPPTSNSIGAMTRSLLTPRPEAFNLTFQPASVLGEIVLIA